MDKDSPKSRSPEGSETAPSSGDVDELYRKLGAGMRRSKPDADSIAAAMEAVQRLAAEGSAEESVSDSMDDFSAEPAGVCSVCGYRNRGSNRFCGMCGAAIDGSSEEPGVGSRRSGAISGEERRPRPIALRPNPFLDPEPEANAASGSQPSPDRHGPSPRTANVSETHHYHHHYHYFTGGQETTMPRGNDPVRPEPARDERFRPTAASLRGDMSRAEAAVRRITQEWVLACNTKHLDDLLELYVADALVLRSNYPPVRGAAAVREFFFGALDAGMGDVEIEPLRVEVAGDMAYEAGRFKALVPGAAGKRREERGKYLWVCSRQPNGEWKLAVDSWSSDLALTSLESDAPPAGGVRSSQPRKTS